jgi:hypothetical protein
MTVPIVPGPDPDQPQYLPPVSPPPPVYQQPYAPQGYQPSGTHDVVKKSAIGTVTVIATLVGLFCVLPMLPCFGMAACGALLPSTPN